MNIISVYFRKHAEIQDSFLECETKSNVTHRLRVNDVHETQILDQYEIVSDKRYFIVRMNDDQLAMFILTYCG